MKEFRRKDHHSTGHHVDRADQLPVLFRALMAAVATVATPIGVRLAGRIREDVLRRLFALFLFVAAGAVAFAR